MNCTKDSPPQLKTIINTIKASSNKNFKVSLCSLLGTVQNNHVLHTDKFMSLWSEISKLFLYKHIPGFNTVRRTASKVTKISYLLSTSPCVWVAGRVKTFIPKGFLFYFFNYWRIHYFTQSSIFFLCHTWWIFYSRTYLDIIILIVMSFWVAIFNLVGGGGAGCVI